MKLELVRAFLSSHIRISLVLVLSAVAIIWPRVADPLLARIEKFASGLAERKVAAVISIAAAAIFLRLALLPVAPIPAPAVQDEFSYLLAADTFAHGRLSNPAHPMWVYLDTFHVLQHPTYISKYPPAQGAVLALGQLLGNPWIGVLLSTAAMVAAVVWALQEWLPPQWAFLGGVLVLFQLGLFGYWIDSYWGGSVAALGGALSLGALARIVKHWRPRDAVILGLGEALLANSRPLEGFLFSLPVMAYLLFHFFRQQKYSWRSIRTRFLIPFVAVMAVCAVFMLYYNERGTGHPLLFPYTLYDRTYQLSTPALLWQKPAPPQAYRNPQFDALFNGWARNTSQSGRANSLRSAIRILRQDIQVFVGFFLWPEFCLPLLAIFWIVRDRRARFFVLQMALCFAGFLLVSWFFPHYAGPIVVTTFALLTQGMRHLRKWAWRGSPVGIGLSRVVVLSAIVLAPLRPANRADFDLKSRSLIQTELLRKPGGHLVIVHYSPQHDPLHEWVYNSASIDQSKVVWAREIPGVDISPLLNYFRGRQLWVVDADSVTPQVRPYTAQPASR
jgi:hypothetical protein